MKVSICIPYHDTPETAYFLSRLLSSVYEQTFKDYEIVLTKEGAFARNHNATIQKAKGEIVQFLQMDDGFADKDSLQRIVDKFDQNPDKVWAISGSLHNVGGTVCNPHTPYWTDDIWTGNNRLGSVSTLSFRREKALMFEEPLSWLVDVDLYYRLYLKYGQPLLHSDFNVVIDTRETRLTSTLSDELKLQEFHYLRQKYGK